MSTMMIRGVISSGVAAALLFGCKAVDTSVLGGSAPTSNGRATSPIVTLSSSTALPACTADNQGQVYYVAPEGAFHYCESGAYQVIELPAAPGALVDSTDAATCPSGGVSIITGLDGDVDGVLDPEEVTTSRQLCNANGGVAAGGVRSSCTVQDGGDGTKTVACSDGTSVTVVAVPGATGAPPLLDISPVPRGPDCAYGGNLVELGTDDNLNGSLEPEEVTSRDFACASAAIADTTLPDVGPPLETNLTIEAGDPTFFSAEYSDDIGVFGCDFEYRAAGNGDVIEGVLNSNDGLTGTTRARVIFPALPQFAGRPVTWLISASCRDAAGNVGSGPAVSVTVLPAPVAGTCAIGGTYQRHAVFHRPMSCVTTACTPDVCARAQAQAEADVQSLEELTAEETAPFQALASDQCSLGARFSGANATCSFDLSFVLTDVDGTCAETCGDGALCSAGRCVSYCVVNDTPVAYDTAAQSCLSCGGTHTIEPLGTACPPEALVWPNPLGPSNSSPWLREHHDELLELRPRVLVLDVAQGTGRKPIVDVVREVVDTTAALTTYHGYTDPNAKPFLRYHVDKIIDFKDPGGAVHPAPLAWPVVGRNIGPLFSQAFAPRLGYADPADPSRFLTMCELFERGIINELWIAAEDDRVVYENQSRLQIYDDGLQPVPDAFNSCTNGCLVDPDGLASCSVSVRIQEINKARPGCFTHAAGHTFEGLRSSIPYLATQAARFFGTDLDTRYGLGIDSLNRCPFSVDAPGSVLCVSRPSPDVLSNGPGFPGDPFSISGWGAACGSVHYPPNANYAYDYHSLIPALSSCESYGLGANPDGSDVQSVYTAQTIAEYEARFGTDSSCGGGWMVYMGQSVPGPANPARDTNGQPMRNWWPFLFY